MADAPEFSSPQVYLTLGWAQSRRATVLGLKVCCFPRSCALVLAGTCHPAGITTSGTPGHTNPRRQPVSGGKSGPLSGLHRFEHPVIAILALVQHAQTAIVAITEDEELVAQQFHLFNGFSG